MPYLRQGRLCGSCGRLRRTHNGADWLAHAHCNAGVVDAGVVVVLHPVVVAELSMV